MGVWLFSVVGLVSLNWCNASILSDKLPCHYLDSINITDGVRQSDGIILHNGIRFAKDQYAQINYKYKLNDGDERITVAPYIRGCLCNNDNKPCLRLCCPNGTFYKPGAPEEERCLNHTEATQFQTNVINENNKIEKRVLDEYFAYVHDIPCSEYYKADDYGITHTGTIVIQNRSVPHREYCLLATYDEEINETMLNAVICFTKSDTLDVRYHILPYGMLLSVPFLLATMLVYVCIPELRNLHGKCLLCYLIGLVIGYTTMALVQLNGTQFIEPSICIPIGYVMYFSFLSAFLWLSVISFDLWRNFRSTNGFLMISENKCFILYMIYAWGLSTLFSIIVFVLDSIPTIPESLRPGMGQARCFLQGSVMSRLLFFYLPMCIICSINIVFFLLTALKIRKVKQDLKKVTSQDESSRHQSKFHRDKDNFTLYLRLFIVMGVIWSAEGLSFVISEESNIFLITDTCNTIHGVFIFILFVLKRRVFRIIKKRWNFCFGTATTNGSVATNSTSATCAPSNFVLNQITSPK